MFPSIYIIGKQLDEEEFKKQRLSSAGWVHNESLVKKILSAEYNNIFPLHIELCSTYKCNFNCPWCSCRKSRISQNDIPSLSYSELCLIIDECYTHSSGIQWTGGEPLINPYTVPAIEYASNKSVKQCLFTNGSLLDEPTVERLLRTNLSFVRVSLNSAGIEYHQLFHGKISKQLSEQVLINLERFACIKNIIRSNVRLGLSLVLDSNNILNFKYTLNYIIDIKKKYPFSVDYIIIRPVNDDFDGVITEKSEKFTSQYNDVLCSSLLLELQELGVQVVTPNEYYLPYIQCEKCYGCSVFSEIAPDGSMFMCSDKYGDRNYIIGNILHNTMDEIWTSDLRYNAIEKNSQCFKKQLCPQFSRGWYFNIIFEQVESFRKAEKLLEVEKWILDLRSHIPYSEHSFFI